MSNAEIVYSLSQIGCDTKARETADGNIRITCEANLSVVGRLYNAIKECIGEHLQFCRSEYRDGKFEILIIR